MIVEEQSRADHPCRSGRRRDRQHELQRPHDMRRGAMILTRTELIEARREDSSWRATVRGPDGDRTIRSRALVNAAGPWAERLLERVDVTRQRRRVHLVKGSHIVLPRLYAGEHAFILQNPDGRGVFAIPFEDRFTLVGTTDVEWSGGPEAAAISEGETDYLLGTVARNFAARPSRADIVWSYSGVRTLVDNGSGDPSKATRDYLLDLDTLGAPLLSVLGGKLTTYRSLAEKALDRLVAFFPKASPGWTRDAVLPGGDIPDLDVERYAQRLRENWHALPSQLLSRFARSYGTRTEALLSDIRSTDDLGEHFGGGLYAREVDYLVANEWARTAEDVLFRRTKLGLHLDQKSTERLSAYQACP